MNLGWGIVVGLGLLGWGASAAQGDEDLLNQIGVSEESARYYLLNNVATGNSGYPSSQQLRKLSMEARVAMVPALGRLARAYVESDLFLEQYRQLREERRPEPPEAMSSVDEDRRKYKEQLQESIKQAEANLNSLPAEYRDGVRQSIEFLKEQLKAADDPDNPMFSSSAQEYRDQAGEMQLEEHRKRVAEWEREYPEDPTPLVRKRLEAFLELADEVDFGATVTANQSGRLIFDNPAYERKPDTWKALYRAGKAPVDAARDFVRRWLAEL